MVSINVKVLTSNNRVIEQPIREFLKIFLTFFKSYVISLEENLFIKIIARMKEVMDESKMIIAGMAIPPKLVKEENKNKSTKKSTSVNGNIKEIFQLDLSSSAHCEKISENTKRMGRERNKRKQAI